MSMKVWSINLKLMSAKYNSWKIINQNELPLVWTSYIAARQELDAKYGMRTNLTTYHDGECEYPRYNFKLTVGGCEYDFEASEDFYISDMNNSVTMYYNVNSGEYDASQLLLSEQQLEVEMARHKKNVKDLKEKIKNLKGKNEP